MNRKADFFAKRIDSHNESNRFESRIGMLYHELNGESDIRVQLTAVIDHPDQTPPPLLDAAAAAAALL